MIKRILFSILFLIIGCSNGGPLTPVESYDIAVNSVKSKNYEKFFENLSENTIIKLEKFQKLLGKLEKKQLNIISSTYNIKPEKLKILSLKELSALMFMSERSKSTLRHLKTDSPREMNVNGSYAEIKTHSGRNFLFVKDGPYWKMDLSDL